MIILSWFTLGSEAAASKRKTLQSCCSPTMDARKIFGIFNYHKDERNLSSFLYSFCFRGICVALMIGLGISSVCLSNFQSLNIFASLRKNLIIISAFSHITLALERAILASTYDRFSLSGRKYFMFRLHCVFLCKSLNGSSISDQ